MTSLRGVISPTHNILGYRCTDDKLFGVSLRTKSVHTTCATLCINYDQSFNQSTNQQSSNSVQADKDATVITS